MRLRYLAAAPLAATLIALTTAPALSQATQSQPAAGGSSTMSAAPVAGLAMKGMRELDDDDRTTQWQGMTVEQLEDMDIVNAQGDSIGEVEEVLADAQGNIVAVTAEVGGFLGIGDREVVVSLEHLQLQGDRFMTNLTSEQLETMPRWDDD